MIAVAVHRLPHGRDLPLPERATPHAAGMDLRAAIPAGETWVLAVNTRPKPVEAKLNVLGATKPVTVVFEGRAVPASGNAWSDQFGPYERHVYCLGR